MLSKEQAEKIRQQFLTQLAQLPQEQASKLKKQIESATPEQLEQLAQAQVAEQEKYGGCLFCAIVSGKIPTFKIYETKNWIAILDIMPACKGHTLVMPKQHFQFFFQLSDELLSELCVFLKSLIPVLINVTAAQGLSIVAHQGIEQRIPHFSFSLMPRFKDDNLLFEQERKQASKEELEKLAKEISARVSRTEGERKTKEIEKTEEKKKREAEMGFIGKRLPR